jgi:hypothetical protein
MKYRMSNTVVEFIDPSNMRFHVLVSGLDAAALRARGDQAYATRRPPPGPGYFAWLRALYRQRLYSPTAHHGKPGGTATGLTGSEE